jgi:rRNA-processing protein FCF1
VAAERLRNGKVNLKVFVDTSVFLHLSRHRNALSPDFISGYLDAPFELLITDSVKEELVRFSRGRGKKALFARLGLKLAEGMRIVKTGSANGDDSLIAVTALEPSCVVYTDDSFLRKRLLALGVHCLTLTGDGRLAMN